MTDASDRLAAEIRRVREEAQSVEVPERGADEVLGEARTPRPPEAPPPLDAAPALVMPRPPDGTEVNQSWDLRPLLAGGGLVGRLLRRLLTPLVEAQVTFNSR